MSDTLRSIRLDSRAFLLLSQSPLLQKIEDLKVTLKCIMPHT